ncbi:MAG: hypothetical protein Q7S33_01560 [Nanoarchaeota archaeon]|nr:hypothetical protein [Nanoarchaeota archaeon]
MRQVQAISIFYYSRKDVQEAIFEFCKNRETVPRYVESFGKRPDLLDFPSDILNSAKNGATSFHCSEELWEDPLKISKEMNQSELNNLKIGWDFLIDIDSKYLDYSKIAADLIIKALKYHGVNSVGVKFSGSKGFHLIVPWKAFPKEINEEKTKNKFPEWPRLIAGYLQEIIHDDLIKQILQSANVKELENSGKEFLEAICVKCDSNAITQMISKYKCKNCKAEIQSMKSVKKTLRCPGCNGDMEKTGEEKLFVCNTCQTNSLKFPEQFIERQTAKELIDSVDIVLVAPRHLFRVPYSLHEKTALASIVIEKEEIKNFQPQMADPLKLKIKNFIPNSEEGEARELLIQAIDWAKRKNKIEKKFTGNSIDIKNLTFDESMFPDCIKKILAGIKQDGRKRALFILLSFFSSLNFPQEYIEEKLEEWNKKNYKKLEEGYIRSQISWFSKNKIMPPNCDKSYYKELGIQCSCQNVKNPINYTIKKAMSKKGNFKNA